MIAPALLPPLAALQFFVKVAYVSPGIVGARTNIVRAEYVQTDVPPFRLYVRKRQFYADRVLQVSNSLLSMVTIVFLRTGFTGHDGCVRNGTAPVSGDNRSLRCKLRHVRCRTVLRSGTGASTTLNISSNGCEVSVRANLYLRLCSWRDFRFF